MFCLGGGRAQAGAFNWVLEGFPTHVFGVQGDLCEKEGALVDWHVSGSRVIDGFDWRYRLGARFELN